VEIFRAKGLSDCFVVADHSGQLWLVPNVANGWELRSPYRIDPLLSPRILRPVSKEVAAHIGAPDGIGRISSAPLPELDEAPAQRRATRPTKTPPGRRSGLRSPKSFRL